MIDAWQYSARLTADPDLRVGQASKQHKVSEPAPPSEALEVLATVAVSTRSQV